MVTHFLPRCLILLTWLLGVTNCMASEQSLLPHKVLKIASVADAHSSKMLRTKALDTLITTPTSTTLPKELGGGRLGMQQMLANQFMGWKLSGSLLGSGDKRLWKADFFSTFFGPLFWGERAFAKGFWTMKQLLKVLFACLSSYIDMPCAGPTYHKMTRPNHGLHEQSRTFQ